MLRRLLALAAVAATAALIVAAPWQAPPSAAQMSPPMGQPLDQLTGDAFDRAFLEQMTMHHAMAVMMARPVVANSARPELKDFANTIIADQTREIAQMRTWARDWYGLDVADPLATMSPPSNGGMPADHAAMGHGSSGGSSGMGGGMAAPGAMGGGQSGMGGMPMGNMQMGDMSMMNDLWKLPPNRLDAVFLTLMIPHHQGAIDMAALVSDRAGHQEIKDLSLAITQSQAGEIQQINGWLAAWFGL